AVRREVKKFCEAMIRENVNIPWYCTSGLRVDLIDEEIATLLHQAGCYTATIAIESASQRTLNHMKKNLNLAKVPEHIRILHTADIPYSPPGVSRRELKWLQRKAFLRFHLRPRVLWATIRNIQSFSHLHYLIRRIFDYIFVRRRYRAQTSGVHYGPDLGHI